MLPTATTTRRAATKASPAARKGRAATKKTADQTKADADAVIDGLVDGTPEATLAFLGRLAAERARAQQFGIFKLWSIGNRCYIEGQVRRRGANVKNLFAGVKQWEKIGRKVVDSELDKPYKIQGSPFYTVNGDTDPVTGEVEKIEKCGRAAQISVYDWTQTVAIDPDYIEPDWEVPVASGDLTTLRQLAEAAEILVDSTVTYTDLSATNHHATYTESEIVIDSAAPVGNQIIALATTLAHQVLGHPADAHSNVLRAHAGSSQRRKELVEARAIARAEAALVGWMVATALGLDEDTDGAATELTRSYLHNWVKVNNDGTTLTLEGTKSRRKMLRERMNDAIKAADTILAAYCADTPETDAPREGQVLAANALG